MPVIENITVLFTDLVGSTELVSSLSPEAGDEIRRRHFSSLRRAIADTGGTELKNLGDGVMVVFSTASAALTSAVAMQQAIDRDNRMAEHPLGLRIGLSGGEVSRDTDDYFGDPVIEAARLCARAEGGQILVAELVRAMAGRWVRLDFRPLGEIKLKGLPDPVATLALQWEPLEVVDPITPAPLPGRLSVRPGLGVVGRQVELTAIADAFKRVAAGGGREVLLVSGEAGQGKTTLMAEAARAAFDQGALVLFGHSEEDLASPYQLVAEALGHYIAHVSDDQLPTLVGEHGSELVRLVPTLAGRLPDLPASRATDADTERFLLFAAVLALLATVSEHQPVVLVLDDLQWADPGSLLLLRHFASSDQSLPVLVLGNYRDDELPHSDALRSLLAALHRQNGVSRIELPGLDDTGVVALVEAAAGHDLDDAAVDLAHALYRETDGNPFFVSEVLRHLSETGAIYLDATGRWVAEHGPDRMTLPDSVREVIGARVGRLGPEAGSVLGTAAVIGRHFDLEVLAPATGTTEDDLFDILESAASAALVREHSAAAGRYSFVHALIQHTLYDDLGPSRRARAHRRVAEALEGLGRGRPDTRLGELARHWVKTSQPADLAKALDYSRRAADAALAALAPADALGYYAQALDLYSRTDQPDPVLGLDLAIGLGTAQRQTGDPAYRETLLDAARRAARTEDTGRLVAAALANDRGFYSAVGAIDADKVEVLNKALDMLDGADPDRSLVLATLCSELTHGSALEQRQALAEEAVAVAESSGDDATVVRVLNHLYVPLQVPALLELALARTSDALARAERVGDPALLFWAAMWRGEVAARAGDIETMDRCIEIHASTAALLNQPIFHWGHTFFLGLRAQIAGDTDRADALASEALRIGTDGGQLDAAVIFGAQLMIVSGQRGTMSDLVPLIEQLATETPDISRWLFGSLLAKAHVEGGRMDQALRLLEEFAASGFDLPLDQVWLTGMVDYAEAAVECRDPRYAAPLFDRLQPWAGQVPATGASALGPVNQYLGGLAAVLGRDADADAYFAEAAAFSDRVGAMFFLARTRLWWGRMLAERLGPGDAEQARDLLTKAHAAAVEHGYGQVTRQAAEARQRLDGGQATVVH